VTCEFSLLYHVYKIELIVTNYGLIFFSRTLLKTLQLLVPEHLALSEEDMQSIARKSKDIQRVRAHDAGYTLSHLLLVLIVSLCNSINKQICTCVHILSVFCVC
jgi:hypothetical protein